MPWVLRAGLYWPLAAPAPFATKPLNNMAPVKTKRTAFPEISPQAWEHPADRAALNALRKVPGLDTVMRVLIGAANERIAYLYHLASAIRVNERQLPRVNNLVLEACHVLDVKEVPPVFVVNQPVFNAGAWGASKPFMTYNSAMVEEFTDDELIDVIGHELGHIKSGHVVYKTAAYILREMLARILFTMPLGIPAILAVGYALMEWSRKAEYSCDRAGLLVSQNLDQSLSVNLKLAGGKLNEDINLDEFVSQAEEYYDSKEIVDNIYKLLLLLPQTHPFAALRTRELIKWHASGEYEAILGGDYVKEGEYTETGDDFNKAGREYAEDTKHWTKPFAEAFDDLTKGMGEASGKAKEFFGSFFDNKNGEE